MSYLGDIAVGATLNFKFTTRRFSTGAPFALSGGVVRVYKDSSDVEDDSGITLTLDFDGRTGLNHVTIDTSADGTFYSAGSGFQVVITVGTVDSISVVGETVAHFSIANRPVQGISATERAAVADAILNRDMSTGTDSGSTTVRTVRQALRFLRNKWSIAGGTLTITKEDDSTASWTAAVTTTAGNPLSASDPAGP